MGRYEAMSPPTLPGREGFKKLEDQKVSPTGGDLEGLFASYLAMTIYLFTFRQPLSTKIYLLI
jgi:hypothetical protein